MKRMARGGKKFFIIPLLILCGLILLVMGAYAAWNFLSTHEDGRVFTANDDKQPEKPAEIRIKVAAMGDMLAHDTIISNAQTGGGYDFGKYFSQIRSAYEDADVVFCNQEGLSSGPAFGISGYPSFNAPTEFAVGLKNGGCNMINLANNHMGDRGTAAINATLDVWDTLNPYAVSGANRNETEQNTVRYFEVEGIKIGFVSFAEFNNVATPAYAVNLYRDEALVRRLVTEAVAEADVVIVSMHWGTEDSNIVNSDQIAQTNLLASLGVDVVIGTGPHVLQKAETLSRPDGGRMVVWYSLGNMLSSQLNAPQLFSGIAHFEIVKDIGVLRVENLSFTPTYMHYEWSASDRLNGNIAARRNAMIYLLDDAAEPLSRSQLGTSVQAQRAYITSIIGPGVHVK